MNSNVSDGPLFIRLDDTDPAAVQALSEARKTLPQFLKLARDKQFPAANYLVKVPFIDSSDTGEQGLVLTAETAPSNSTRPICHLWLSVTSVFEDLVFACVGEAPEALHLKHGASFVVNYTVIEDWLISQDGIAFGGFSLRVIRGLLPTDEQLRFDIHTGIREFKAISF